MLNSPTSKMIKVMAKQYRMLHVDYTIKKAVAKANEAYDIFRESEVSMMDSEYGRTTKENKTIRF